MQYVSFIFIVKHIPNFHYKYKITVSVVQVNILISSPHNISFLIFYFNTNEKIISSIFRGLTSVDSVKRNYGEKLTANSKH